MDASRSYLIRNLGSFSSGEAVVHQNNRSPLSYAEFHNGWPAIALLQKDLACTEATFILLLT